MADGAGQALALDAEELERVRADYANADPDHVGVPDIRRLLATVEARDTRLADAHAQLEAAQNEIADLRSGIKARKNRTHEANRKARREQENAAQLATELADARTALCKTHRAWKEDRPLAALTPGEVAAIAAARATEGDRDG